MSTIPKAIQDEAEKRFPNLPYISNHPGYTEEEYKQLHSNISDGIKQRQQDFIAGYQLATDGREELEKLILEMAADRRELASKYNDLVEFKESIEKGDDRYYKQIELERKNLLSEITALQSQCTEKDQEIERLKYLVERAFWDF